MYEVGEIVHMEASGTGADEVWRVTNVYDSFRDGEITVYFKPMPEFVPGYWRKKDSGAVLKVSRTDGILAAQIQDRPDRWERVSVEPLQF